MSEAATQSVTLTERAARRIGEILKREPSGAMLRVSVEGGGCSGFQYKFDFDQSRTEEDLVLARDGVVVLIDALSQQYMAGAEIDYVDDLIGASFKINNPVATSSCGCGTSFLSVRRSCCYSAAMAGREGSATSSSCGSNRRRLACGRCGRDRRRLPA